MLRENYEDNTLRAPNIVPGSDTVILPKQTQLTLDMVSTSRNPRHFAEPHEFRPQRWAEPGAIDAFLGFSVGPRACLGKKFSTVEGVAFLSNALRDWKFDIKLEKGETVESWSERMLRPMIGVTLKLGEC